jgi:hypothetical protein
MPLPGTAMLQRIHPGAGGLFASRTRGSGNLSIREVTVLDSFVLGLKGNASVTSMIKILSRSENHTYLAKIMVS